VRVCGFFSKPKGAPRANPFAKHCYRLYAMDLGATHRNLSRWGRDKFLCCQGASCVTFDKNVCKCRSQPVPTLVPCLVTVPLAHFHWRNRLLQKADDPPEYTFFFLGRCGPTRSMVFSFLRCLGHAQRCTTVGRTPLDEWSLRRRDFYLTTHNTHKKQTSMPTVGFEPTIPASERPLGSILNIIHKLLR